MDKIVEKKKAKKRNPRSQTSENLFAFVVVLKYFSFLAPFSLTDFSEPG